MISSSLDDGTFVVVAVSWLSYVQFDVTAEYGGGGATIPALSFKLRSNSSAALRAFSANSFVASNKLPHIIFGLFSLSLFLSLSLSLCQQLTNIKIQKNINNIR